MFLSLDFMSESTCRVFKVFKALSPNIVIKTRISGAYSKISLLKVLHKTPACSQCCELVSSVGAEKHRGGVQDVEGCNVLV